MNKEAFKNILAHGYCQSCENDTSIGEPLHPCPYKADIWNNEDDMCNCCAECIQICVYEI